jgi:Leucine-rich repeat (LRR) protein
VNTKSACILASWLCILVCNVEATGQDEAKAVAAIEALGHLVDRQDGLAGGIVVGVRNCSGPVDGLVGQLKYLGNLRSVSLAGPGVTNDNLKLVGKLSEVVNLRLCFAAVDDDGIRYLRAMPKLQELDLSYTAVTGKSLHALASVKTLHTLVLDASSITDEGMSGVRSLTQLRGLWVAETGITDKALGHFEGLRNLRRLSLAHTPICGGLERLAKMAALVELDVSGTKLKDSGTIGLKSLKNLERLLLRHTEITDGAIPTIGTLRKLKTVCVGDTNITDKGLQELKRLLPDAEIIP